LILAQNIMGKHWNSRAAFT